MKYQSKGFTLIELLVVVAIIGVIAAIALPAYEDYVIKARRADAKTALLEVQLAQEKWRANNTAYTTSVTSLGVSTVSDDGYYTIAVTAASGTAYTTTATPRGTHTDAKCNVFTYTSNGSPPESVNGSQSAAQCWNK